MGIEIRFWGVRGSVPAPGPGTARIGGNTSCVEVRCGAHRIVLDAGTGLRPMGNAWMAEGGPIEATVLLSHLHWDHIQGLPFFVPLYLGGTSLEIVGPGSQELPLEGALERQMRAPTFPVRWAELPSSVTTRQIHAGQSFELGGGEITVRTAKGHHPGGVVAYRIEHAGRSVVYATDTEHYRCVDPTLLRLAEDADALIYDSQYTPSEYRGGAGMAKVGWGHSTWEAGVELARAAGVGQYVLFHHDPSRTDAQVEALEREARARFGGSVAAREGMSIELEGRDDAKAA